MNCRTQAQKRKSYRGVPLALLLAVLIAVTGLPRTAYAEINIPAVKMQTQIIPLEEINTEVLPGIDDSAFLTASNFPDANFWTHLSATFDVDKDTQLSREECAKVD